MGVSAPTTNFVGLEVTLTKTQCKAAISAPYQSRQDARKVEDLLEKQPQRFVMLGINPDSYNAVVWVTSQFFGPLNSRWLNRKQRDPIPDTFDSLVRDIRKTSLLPNIRDDAIYAMLGLG
jgi:topoisomerase IA-like protein